MVLPTVISPWHWRIAPRLALSASPTASASSFEPGMYQGTIFVSARKTASVLIGGQPWFVVPKAAADGAGGWRAALGAGRRWVVAPWIWDRAHGFLGPPPPPPP